MQSVAPMLGVELSPIDVRDVAEIERILTGFSRGSSGGLIATGSALAAVHRALVITLAAQHRLPAVYPARFFVTDGGLVSYGPDTVVRGIAKKLKFVSPLTSKLPSAQTWFSAQTSLEAQGGCSTDLSRRACRGDAGSKPPPGSTIAFIAARPTTMNLSMGRAASPPGWHQERSRP
jgi:hypothetical protein